MKLPWHSHKQSDLDDEIEAHLQMAARDRIDRGEPADQAVAAARREFGNVALTKDLTRDTWAWRWLERLSQDVRYALRTIRKSPSFAIVVVLTLALGIGANTATFSYISTWLIKPPPYPSADRIVAVMTRNTKRGWYGPGASPADFYDWQRESHAFDDLSAWSSTYLNLTSDGAPERILAGRVSANFFPMLGMTAELGRVPSAEEDQPGAAHVVVVSHAMWRSRFASDATIIGRTITLSDTPYTIIGVLSADFHFPLIGAADAWVPLAFSATQKADRENRSLGVLGRMRSGVTVAQANADLGAVAARLAHDYPESNRDLGVLMQPLQAAIADSAGGDPAMIAFWVVSLVLLIACANVAGLLLARGAERSREFAVRAAVGAGRGRLVRQLLTEALVLFIAGAAAGMLVAGLVLRWIDTVIPDRMRASMPNYGHAHLDVITLLYALAVALLSALLFGLAPALLSSRVDLNSVLKDSSAQASGSRGRAWMRKVFVAGEVALALVVVVCSALLIESFLWMQRAESGFAPENLTVAKLTLPANKYAHAHQIRWFSESVLARIAGLPHVDAAAVSQAIPFTGGTTSSGFAYYNFEIIGRPATDPDMLPTAAYTAVTPEFFSTLRIPIIRGRSFSAADGATSPPVVILGQELARRFWPKGDPIGEQIRIKNAALGNPICTVVGIARNVRLSSTASAERLVLYVPFGQFPGRNVSIVVRSSTDTAAIAGGIRQSVWAVDRDQPIALLAPMRQFMDEQYSPFGAMARVMAFFSSLALMLTAIGIYGLASYTVRQRVHEIGVRMALGAQRGHILRLVLGQGLMVTFVGIATGLVCAFGAGRFLAFMLFGVGKTDVPTYAGMALLLCAVAVLACYIPARHAMRVDPIAALRYE